MSEAPERPTSLQESAIGFKPRRPVQWLSPRELASTGLQVVVSGLFGTFADKREMQGVMSAAVPDHLTAKDELWIDYVSDIGDGFDATYTIARMLAEPTLDIGVPNRRGDVLVMGGDEVYPTAKVAAYQDRTVGPYKAACPHNDDKPLLYALPGNHDWYDGLTAFLRVFCQSRWIGGWKTCQTRSYWAVQLPARWWLWGIDIQFDTYIDEPQLRFFRTVAETEGPAGLEPGDAVILCSAKPSWVKANEEETEAYATLDFFEREIIRPKEAEVRLSLTGDTHHYARYQRVGGTAQKITAGGGGAYLSATHHLPEDLLLPPPASRDPGKSMPPVPYERQACYPSWGTSTRLRLGAFRLLWRNWGFLLLAAALHLLFCFAVASELRGPADTFAGVMDRLSSDEVLRVVPRSGTASMLAVFLLAGLIGFTKPKHRKWRAVLGVVHAVTQVALLVDVLVVASAAADGWHDVRFDAVFVFVGAVAGGIGSGIVMALYLVLADIFATNDNELFAAQGIVDYKCFLRMHLAADGELTVYPIRVDRVGRGRKLYQSASKTKPWIDHKRPPSDPVLIEPPIRIPREGP
jgi:Calcineurin-like phosphoesterase